MSHLGVLPADYVTVVQCQSTARCAEGYDAVDHTGGIYSWRMAWY